MQLTVHDRPGSFHAETAAFLRAAEAEYSTIAIPVARMIEAPEPGDADAYLASVADAGTVVAAAMKMQRAQGVLITAGPAAAHALIANDLHHRGVKPRSVVGPLGACEAFARAWRDATGEAHSLRFHLRHFELTAAPSAPPARGRMRRPDADDKEQLVAWQIAFIAEAYVPEDPAHTRAAAVRRFERGALRIWDDEGIVAFAGFGSTASGAAIARIAPVYTPPPLRGRGYASALVAALCKELFDQGKRAIFLTTDVANPTSNDIYRRIGFRATADHFHFDLVPLAP